MNRKKVVLELLLIVIITSSFFSNVINASFNYNSYSGLDVSYSMGQLETSMCQMPNNKMIFIYHKSGVKLEVYSDSDGSKLQENTLDFGSYNNYICGKGVYAYNSTHAILLVIAGYSGTTYAKVSLYNMATNSFSDSNTLTVAGNQQDSWSLLYDDYIIYNDDIYFITTTLYDTLRIYKYDVDTNTLSEEIENALGGGFSDVGIPLVAHNEETNPEIIVVGHKEQGTEYPKYYKVDLEADTITHLCDHPLTTERLESYTLDNEGARSSYITNRDRFLGGDILYNGSDIWVYFTWLHSYVDSATVIRATQHRLVFNTSISSGNLLGQNERTITTNPNDVNNETLWTNGYMIDKNQFVFYYPHQISGVDYIRIGNIVIDDWWNYGISSVDDSFGIQSGDYPDTFVAENDNVDKNFEGYWIVTLDESDDCKSGRLYYGAEPLIVTYDIDLSYSPDDSPLIVDKSYSYELTTYVNGIGTSRVTAVYIDGNQQMVKQSSSNGKITFDFASGYEGIREFEISILDAVGSVVYSETFYYTFERTEISDEPTSDILIPRATTYLVAVLPTLIMVAFPTVALGVAGADIGGSVGGSIGLLSGLSIGVGMSALSGFLPTYMIYLLILIICTAVVMIVRGR